MANSYANMTVVNFLDRNEKDILNEIVMASIEKHELSEQQKFAWQEEIRTLKNSLKNFRYGHLIFEYNIPRLGKRIDVVMIYSGAIYVIEFKANKEKFEKQDMEQCMDYALDLKYFHKQSHDCHIIPILIPTNATDTSTDNKEYKIFDDHLYDLIHIPPAMLEQTIKKIEKNNPSLPPIDPDKWMDSLYYPTPTIIEAAQKLYSGHTVNEIGSPEDSDKLDSLMEKLDQIIKYSKDNSKKSICFITGIPGSGKTLAGLNLVSDKRHHDDDEPTVFLSGNYSLVSVLRRALVLDQSKREKMKIKDAERLVNTFIQHMYEYRNESLKSDVPLAERIVVFDEAQRAWTQKRLEKYLKKEIGKSEPALLMETLDRHQGWAVLICLVGNGQEIHDGEIGVPAWFTATREYCKHWRVFLSEKVSKLQDVAGSLDKHLEGLDYEFSDILHLDQSMRSFKDPSVSAFINYVMDNADSYDPKKSKDMIKRFDSKYKIRITRDIDKAKSWIKGNARGTERYGMIAHHDSDRLRPYGICIDPKLDAAKWFLEDSDNIYSSYYMEQIANEFFTQGLELDWACVCWDANLRYNKGWDYNEFKGAKWRKIKNPLKETYLKNSYRVLLTRARQGMVIFVPHGDDSDHTRQQKDYDGIYNYLKSIGIKDANAQVSVLPTY